MSSPATATQEIQESDRSGRHPVNVVHLVMALIFLGVLAVWVVVQGNALDSADLRWLLPVPLLLAGAVGLAAIALSGRPRATPSSPLTSSRTDQDLRDEELPIDELAHDDTEETR